MKKTKIIKIALFCAVLALGLSLGCSKDKNPVAPALPVVEIKALKTTFTGEPITFIATFGYGVKESEIRWNTSRGDLAYRSSRTYRDSLIFTDTGKVTWNEARDAFYGVKAKDSVYVSLFSSNEVSNKITIQLVNHSPILEGVTLNGQALDTTGIIRVHLNPSVPGRLQVDMADADAGDKPTFLIENFETSLSPSGMSYDSIWTFKTPFIDSLYSGMLRLVDGRGGNMVRQLDIVVYTEVHSVWVASTNSPDTCSVSKLTRFGEKLFTLNRFQQVKFLAAFPNNVQGTEAVWIVDRTKKSRNSQLSGSFSDSVFVVDDDGRAVRQWGGMGSPIRAFALNQRYNIGYAVSGDTVRKLTIASSLAPKNFSIGVAGAFIEAIDINHNNIDDYWVGAAIPNASGTNRYVFHVVSGVVSDTLKRAGIPYTGYDVINSIVYSPNNGLLWIGCDTMVVIADADNDSIYARITGFDGAYLTADQIKGEAFCWVADAGKSRLVLINGKPSGNPLSGLHTVVSAG